MTFSFDSDVAKIVGVNGAVLFCNISFWVMKNKANDRHFHDGNYWTYNSTQAFTELFPFLSRQQVRTALDKLVDENLILTGEYNEKDFDRTKWYTLTRKGWEIVSKQPLDLPKSTNALAENNKPIPDINTDIEKKEIPKGISKEKKPSREEVREYVKAKGYHFSADEFYDYYDSANWHKADGKAVKNWKQCCVTWEANRKDKTPQKTVNDDRRKRLE